MRTTVGLLLIAVLIVAPRAPRAAARDTEPRLYQEVRGKGETAEAARRNAFDNARELIIFDLRYNPEIDVRVVSRSFLEKSGMVHLNEMNRDGPPFEVTGRVKVELKNILALRELTRIQSMHQRHRQAALLLGGVVLGLLVLAGLLRLDELTRGYYTSRLLLVALALLALIVSALALWD